MKKNTVTAVVKKTVKPLKKSEPIFIIEDSGYDTGIIISDEDGDCVFDCSTSGFEHCCGACELGSFSLYGTTKGIEPYLDRALNQLISSVTSIGRRGLTPRTKSITLIATLVDNAACNLIRAAFIRTETFSLVKTYYNINSNNKIELWVSTN